MGTNKNMSQMKEQQQQQNPENSSETEITNLPDKKFREMVTRMLYKLEHTIDELRELQPRVGKFNKRSQSEMRKTIMKMEIH